MLVSMVGMVGLLFQRIMEASSKNVSSVVGGDKGCIKVSLKKKNKGKMGAY